MRRALGAGLLAAVLLITGCSDATDDPNPDVSATAVDGAGPEVGADQQFSLDEVAAFDDGLEVEIAGSVAGKSAPGDQGAESTGGEIVTASARIENNTSEPYDPTNASITATYAGQTIALPVTNPTTELTGTFTEVIATGAEGVAGAAFAIPADELAQVSFVIDLRDDTHEPVSFTGRVAQG